MCIIRATLARNTVKLAKMKDPRIKSSLETIAKAHEGYYREEDLFVLKQALELYDFYNQRIEACDRQIEACLSQLDSKAGSLVGPAFERYSLLLFVEK